MKYIQVSEDEVKLSSQSAMITNALRAEKIEQECVSTQSDNDRALDIAQSLEDLHIVMKSMEAPKPVDIALIQVMANTAVSGTPASATGVLPATENFMNKQVSTQGLLDRIGLILNSFTHDISSTFAMLAKFIRSIVILLRENRDTLIAMEKKFPLPDNPADDIPRTVTLLTRDSKYLTTPAGVVSTYGDILNAFNNSVDSFNIISKVNSVIGSRMMQTIRDIIPSSNIDSPAALLEKAKVSNENLFNTSIDLWSNTVSRSGLLAGRSPRNADSATTRVLLGCHYLSLEFKADLAASLVEELSLDKRSEIIRSFKMFSVSECGPTVPGEQVVVSGITNAGIRMLIQKLKDFITDLEKFSVWCCTTAEMTQSQCETDVANISKYFSSESTDKMDAAVAEAYRNYIQTHIGDINSIIKLVVNVSAKPLRYANDLVNGLTVVLNNIPETVPSGNYNLPKIK